MLDYFELIDRDFSIVKVPNYEKSPDNEKQNLKKYYEDKRNYEEGKKGNTFNWYICEDIAGKRITSGNNTMQVELNNYKKNVKFANIDLYTTKPDVWSTDEDFRPFKSTFDGTLMLEDEKFKVKLSKLNEDI
jgi:hypothetical protein